MLPAEYATRFVELAYATTVHGAQGETVDHAHLAIGDTTGAAAAYVAMTRGRMHVERIERQEDLFIARLPTTVLRAGDRLYVRGQSHELKEYETVLGAPLWQQEGAVTGSARRWSPHRT